MIAMYLYSLQQCYVIHVSSVCFYDVFVIAQNIQPSKARPPVSIVSYCCISSIYINLIVH